MYFCSAIQVFSEKMSDLAESLLSTFHLGTVPVLCCTMMEVDTQSSQLPVMHPFSSKRPRSPDSPVDRTAVRDPSFILYSETLLTARAN
jgi:hypothetical protein